MNWKKVKLGDISANIQTGPFGSQLHQYDYSETGTPVVMPKDLIGGKISEQSIARVSQDHVQRLNRYIIQTGDILYSRRGDVGRCAFVTEHERGWLCGTGCLRVTTDVATADSKFVFYQLQQSEVVDWVEKHAVGATMLNLNTTILSNIPLLLPPLSIQRRIADILSAYDDLIDDNRKQIKLLEEAAQRLYKEWFVDLRFPGYEHTKIVDGVPEGWEKKQANAFFDITIGKTPPRAEQQWFTNGKKGVPWVSISDMGNASTFIFDTSEELTADSIERYNIKIVPAGTVLLSFKLTVGRVSISGENMCTNEAIAHFRIADQVTREYAYCYLKNYPYDTLGSTSSISKAINSKIVKAMPFVMPDHAVTDQFSKCCKPFLEQIKTKQKIILNLQQARDRLLPKLMSGEVEM